MVSLALVDGSTPSGGIDLSDELEKLRGIAGQALESGYVDKDSAAGLASLINAVTKLAEFKLKAEQSISAGELRSLVISMGQSVNAHVHDRTVQAKIQREWLGLIGDRVK